MNKAQKEVLQAQLDREKELIKDLKQVFGQAQDDVVNKIIDLSRRQDMENLQTIIYQMQYQEVLKQQIDTVLDQLQTNEYTRIEQYRAGCYTDGYAGGMYNIAKSSGIPCIAPIDVKSVEKAVKIDSKLSKTLYKSLDMSELKKSVRMNVSRGILNGSSWNDIGREIGRTMKGTPFQKAMNNGIRIARTEGHRIQVAANLDAMQAAKERGADVVKQWDATLDETTRERHRELDGQIREIDEYFEYSGGTVKAPGMFGNPAEDCNCRCAVLTRARWALDEEELKTLQERAKYFGLDKTKSFEEFREKYLNATQQTSYDGIPKTWGMLQEGDKAIDTNPQKSNINCVNCTIAYEMRERGYAVVAGDVNKKLRDDPFCGWVNPNVQKVKTNDPYSEIVNSAKQWGAGSRGQITVLYESKSGIYTTAKIQKGHSFNIKNNAGNVQFIDSQKGKIYNKNEVEKIFSRCKADSIKYAQVDKLDVNDRGSHACKKE